MLKAAVTGAIAVLILAGLPFVLGLPGFMLAGLLWLGLLGSAVRKKAAGKANSFRWLIGVTLAAALLFFLTGVLPVMLRGF